MRSKSTAAVIALFGGFIGIHRFYLKQNGLGTLYLLFCWTLIPAVLSWFDFIAFLLISEEKFNEKYNQDIINQLTSIHTSTKFNQELISESYHELLIDFANNGLEMLERLMKNQELIDKIYSFTSDAKTSKKAIELGFIFDLKSIIEMCGGKHKALGDLKNVGGMLVVERFLPDSKTNYSLLKSNQDLNTFIFNTEGLKSPLESLWAISNPLTINYSVGSDATTEVKSAFSLPPLLQLIQSDLLVPYATFLHQFAMVLSKSDGLVSSEEETLLKSIYDQTHNPIPQFKERTKGNVKTTKSENKSLDQALKELHELIGLSEVKEEIQTLVNFVKIQQQREAEGLKTNSISYHIVFTGNPGTGKTTVARLLAQIYKELGLIEKGHLIETDRSGLIAEYSGQTAVKVNKVVDEALDGVLFIDEAYALVGENKDDYGKEAVATLIKRMEDDRKRLIVILAGYLNEMETFIETNPGFKSRINRYIDFKDYEPTEMLDIFKLFLKQSQYKLSKEAENLAKGYFEKAFEQKEVGFGNGRFVRNIFEKCLENQANRLSRLSQIDRKTLMQIEAEDLELV